MPRSPRTIVCSCEDITLEEIEQCVEKGYRDVESVKRFTGFGTGICQGRNCLHLVTRVLIANGAEEQEVIPFTARPPLFPVQLGMLARLDEEHCAESKKSCSCKPSSSESPSARDSSHAKDENSFAEAPYDKSQGGKSS